MWEKVELENIKWGFHMYQLTKSIEQDPSREAESQLTTQEIFHQLCSVEVNYHIVTWFSDTR
jgi:hypothetical protein